MVSSESAIADCPCRNASCKPTAKKREESRSPCLKPVETFAICSVMEKRERPLDQRNQWRSSATVRMLEGQSAYVHAPSYCMQSLYTGGEEPDYETVEPALRAGWFALQSRFHARRQATPSWRTDPTRWPIMARAARSMIRYHASSVSRGRG